MENALNATAFTSHTPQSVDLAAIEQALARFWHDPEALDGGDAGDAGLHGQSGDLLS